MSTEGVGGTGGVQKKWVKAEPGKKEKRGAKEAPKLMGGRKMKQMAKPEGLKLPEGGEAGKVLEGLHDREVVAVGDGDDGGVVKGVKVESKEISSVEVNEPKREGGLRARARQGFFTVRDRASYKENLKLKGEVILQRINLERGQEVVEASENEALTDAVLDFKAYIDELKLELDELEDRDTIAEVKQDVGEAIADVREAMKSINEGEVRELVKDVLKNLE